ncbi:MAG TPA: DUF5663 domain-containing protein [Patescibacteria group bacterium]|nr:DUF5663 domain-containing protein [Patescibacteria group bacterium]
MQLDQNQPVEIPQEILNFLDGIVHDANVEKTSDEEHKELLQELYKRLDSFLIERIVSQLSEADVETFISMQEQKKPQTEIQAFLAEKIPNTQQFFAQSFLEFRDAYVGTSSTLEKIEPHDELQALADKP